MIDDGCFPVDGYPSSGPDRGAQATRRRGRDEGREVCRKGCFLAKAMRSSSAIACCGSIGRSRSTPGIGQEERVGAKHGPAALETGFLHAADQDRKGCSGPKAGHAALRSVQFQPTVLFRSGFMMCLLHPGLEIFRNAR